LADVVAAGDGTLGLAGGKALPGLFLLVRREDRLAAEFDAVGSGVGPAARGAFENAAAFQLRCYAEDGEDDLGEVGRSIKERLGQGPDARTGALHIAGDNQKVGRVAREPVDRRGDHHVAGDEATDEFFKLRPVGGRAGDLLTEYLLAPGRLELGDLAALILSGRRDASIAVNHACIVHQKSASKKRNPINRCAMMQIS
jgi:hypothetical protein